ncbi:MAG: LacI family DNA-binding transcriptional regulator [Micropruina sp.]|nr:LacI family DNA-binding transcriptional regulator [Micropruina sp.]
MSESRSAGTVRRPALRDVAREAGVSEGAVSKVIRNAYGVSPAMRARVEQAIDKLGYRPRTAARAMRGRSFTLGFETPHIGNDLHTLVIEGAAEQLDGSPYQLVIVPGMGRLGAKEILDALVDRQVDGIIAIASEVETEWIEKLARHTPVVILGRHDQSERFDTIINDDVAGTDLVMDHLLGLGHTRIAHLTISSPSAMTPHVFRQTTYVQRMEAAGLSPVVTQARASERGAYEAAVGLLSGPERPTAIFAGHDSLAIGVLRAVADAGLDASEVSVVGYDNIELARHPLVSLTTVDQCGDEAGRVAIQLLMERIEGRTVARHECFTPTLCVRRSSGPAPS